MTTASQTTSRQVAYTVAEAAYLAEVEDKEVNREIDADILTSIGQTSSGERLIDRASVLYVAAVANMRTGLSKELRRTIADAFRTKRRRVTIGNFFKADVAEVEQKVRSRFGEIDNLRKTVVVDPNICGGEPVLRGTRQRVHKVADLRSQGMSLGEFREEFDLTPQQVELAVLYAKLHPRRGRREVMRRNLVEHVPPRR